MLILKQEDILKINNIKFYLRHFIKIDADFSGFCKEVYINKKCPPKEKTTQESFPLISVVGSDGTGFGFYLKLIEVS